MQTLQEPPLQTFHTSGPRLTHSRIKTTPPRSQQMREKTHQKNGISARRTYICRAWNGLFSEKRQPRGPGQFVLIDKLLALGWVVQKFFKTLARAETRNLIPTAHSRDYESVIRMYIRCIARYHWVQQTTDGTTTAIRPTSHTDRVVVDSIATSPRTVGS